MATHVPLCRRLLAAAVAVSAAAALAACSIEFIDNDQDPLVGDAATIDGWSSNIDGWSSNIDAPPLDTVTPPPIDAWDPNLDAPGIDAGIDAASAACGDGVVTGAEHCDNGLPGVNTATCDRDCTLVQCGDALANFPAGEQCDTGGGSVTCDIDCTAVVCGDGMANPIAGEQCDDGNIVDTDGCRNDCTLP